MNDDKAPDTIAAAKAMEVNRIGAKPRKAPPPTLTYDAIKDLATRGEEAVLRELQAKEDEAAKREQRTPRKVRISAMAKRLARKLVHRSRTRAERTASGERSREPSDYARMKAAADKRERKRQARLAQRAVLLQARTP